MPAATYNITADQGSTWNPPAWIHKDSTGALVNLTGYTARMQVRESYSSEIVVLELTTENGGITLGGAAGTIAMLATAAQMAALVIPDSGAGTPPSKRFVYDFELVNGAVVKRKLQGAFIVTREVTR